MRQRFSRDVPKVINAQFEFRLLFYFYVTATLYITYFLNKFFGRLDKNLSAGLTRCNQVIYISFVSRPRGVTQPGAQYNPPLMFHSQFSSSYYVSRNKTLKKICVMCLFYHHAEMIIHIRNVAGQ